MIAVKSASASAQLFVSRASAAGAQYTAGVQNAGATWQANTTAAAPNWAAGVQAAITDGRFANGVQGATNKYQTNAAGKGSRNYVPGVSAAGPAWQAAVTPYLNTIANLTLPPKGPTGSPQNIQRVSAVADALRQQKLNS
jgi:hypothetical protein